MAEWHIVTAARNSGKTTAMLETYDRLDDPEAFITVSHDGKHSLFLKRMKTGEERLLMSDAGTLPESFGSRFTYDQSVFDWCEETVLSSDSDTVMIDEVGRLELSGKGFAPLLKELCGTGRTVWISVRDDHLSDVVKTFANRAAVHMVPERNIE